MRQLVSRLFERMKVKVKLPWVPWSVPTGVLALTAFVVVSAVSIKATSKPVFCTSCHEMDLHYASWSVSSHKGVGCEECHMMPSVSGMFMTKLNGLRLVYVHTKTGGRVNPHKLKGHVPDANCKKCHPTTPEMVVYHGLKITHKKHWDMGIKCTTCHGRVVHGPNARMKNTPTMDTCFKCHDGKTASNNCGTCHETLGTRNPTPFSPQWVAAHKKEVHQSGEKSCERCHQKESCDACHRMSTPHPDDWIKKHAGEYKKNPGRCDVCHPKNMQEPFCQGCHKIRRAHTVDWVAEHQKVVKANPAACDSCHKKDFCSDCHQRYRSHPSDWINTHPAQANAKPESCKTCHASQFCIGCHSGSTPPSHKSAGWLGSHKLQVAQDPAKCQTCHKPGFCMSCHKSRKPQSHSAGWRSAHGDQARTNRTACSTCHSKESCDSCHGMPMPHPSNWSAAHRSAAAKDRSACMRCHKPDMCQSCHSNTRPASHGSSWVSQHGKHADNSCQNCHSKAKCESCHKGGRVKPSSHGKDWLKNHPRTAKGSMAGCRMCHRDSYCTNCHGTPMPHPSGWAMGGHRKQASFAKNSSCYKCHQQRYCYSCHEKK